MLAHTHTVADEDGPQQVSKCTCGRCDNHWWVRCAPEHQPSYCPYCGLKFLGYTNTVGEAFGLSGLPAQKSESTEPEGNNNG